MEYQELKNAIRGHLNRAAEDFFMVGYLLRQVSEQALFAEDGYQNIWEFAKGEYGLSASSASRFMAINARFSVDGGEHMAERYIGMGVSKLQEMLGLPDEELEKVTQETTVKEIRAMKKKQEEPLSFYGLPKTEKGKHPYTYIPGCGDGKYDCFSCARPCGIRQKERYCRTAPMGKPFPCIQMNEEKRNTIKEGVYGEKCQHLHPELAPLISKRNEEPKPCCLNCRYKICYYRCDVAKKRDMEQEDELENVESCCDVATGQDEVEPQQEVEEKKEAQKQKEVERLLKFYKDMYPGTRHVIAQRDKAAITKEFKTVYGSTYENGNGWMCYPDKIVFQDSPDAEQIQITWRRFTTKLVELLDRSPETEKAILLGDEEPTEPEIIEAEFREEEERQQEPESILCNTCEHEGECYGKKTHADGCLGYEERTSEPEAEPNPETYGQVEVRLLWEKYRQDLKEYREVEVPFNVIQRQRILVDALELLLAKQKEEQDKETDEEEILPGQMSLEELIG